MRSVLVTFALAALPLTTLGQGSISESSIDNQRLQKIELPPGVDAQFNPLVRDLERLNAVDHYSIMRPVPFPPTQPIGFGMLAAEYQRPANDCLEAAKNLNRYLLGTKVGSPAAAEIVFVEACLPPISAFGGLLDTDWRPGNDVDLGIVARALGALLLDGRPRCTGMLMTREGRHVVTAAHCLDNWDDDADRCAFQGPESCGITFGRISDRSVTSVVRVLRPSTRGSRTDYAVLELANALFDAPHVRLVAPDTLRPAVALIGMGTQSARLDENGLVFWSDTFRISLPYLPCMLTEPLEGAWLHSCQTHGGFSGAPLIAATGPQGELDVVAMHIGSMGLLATTEVVERDPRGWRNAAIDISSAYALLERNSP